MTDCVGKRYVIEMDYRKIINSSMQTVYGFPNPNEFRLNEILKKGKVGKFKIFVLVLISIGRNPNLEYLTVLA